MSLKVLHDKAGWFFNPKIEKPNFLICEGEAGFDEHFADWLASKPHTKNWILTWKPCETK